jgi:hypothetical protein
MFELQEDKELAALVLALRRLAAFEIVEPDQDKTPCDTPKRHTQICPRITPTANTCTTSSTVRFGALMQPVQYTIAVTDSGAPRLMVSLMRTTFTKHGKAVPEQLSLQYLPLAQLEGSLQDAASSLVEHIKLQREDLGQPQGGAS